MNESKTYFYFSSLTLLIFFGCNTRPNKPSENIALVAKVDSIKIDTVQQICSTDSIVNISCYGKMIDSYDEVFWFTNDLNSFQIDLCAEFSVSIQAEGKHIDLTEWKHGYSKWYDYTAELNSTGTIDEIKVADKIPITFPKTEVEECKAYVRSYVGEDWYRYISKTKSIYDYPLNVGMSRYILRVRGIRKDNGLKAEKIFTIALAMGC